ncbi:MAG: biopolymer transporter ExbD [Phycisphaeraceae bacterium]|nr:biopolymer transporter ExbD [Phycisphaeraceae bacterium]
MFTSVQDRMRDDRQVALVDIAPLIDIVFILLIFFLVTTTFVRDTGLEVNRPEAAAAVNVEPESFRVSIAASGAIHTGGQEVDLGQLQRAIRDFVTREQEHAVLVIPDKDVPAGRLVQVMDAAKLGGARDIAVATRRQR